MSGERYATVAGDKYAPGLVDLPVLPPSGQMFLPMALRVALDPNDKGPKPNTPSSDYQAMSPYWSMISSILGGTPSMRAAGQAYLPRFLNEQVIDYNYRLANCKFTNVYRDIVETLAAKPFSKELKFKEKTTSDAITKLSEDIDAQGNNLNTFASRLFFDGINDAISWVLVDKQQVPEGATVADERAVGARPYWVHVPAPCMLAAYSEMVKGKEEFVHIRIHEPERTRNGFDETTVNYVRVIERLKDANGEYGKPRWDLWKEIVDPTTKKSTWVIEKSGQMGIDVITLVPFITGRRKGTTWQFEPVMKDAAYLQIDHYQQETNLKSVKEQACFPMLSGNGVSPPTDKEGKTVDVPVGPKTVLYAPGSMDGKGGGSWSYVEPSSNTLTFLAADIKNTEQQLRELGRQPLTAQSLNMTVVTTAFAAQKGNTIIQQWAFNLKDALEQALKYTALWLNDSSEPEVIVYTDFSMEIESVKPGDFLLQMYDREVISRQALITESKRRDYLTADYDAEADLKQILADGPPVPPPNEIKNAIAGTLVGGA